MPDEYDRVHKRQLQNPYRGPGDPYQLLERARIFNLLQSERADYEGQLLYGNHDDDEYHHKVPVPPGTLTVMNSIVREERAAFFRFPEATGALFPVFPARVLFLVGRFLARALGGAVG